MSPDRSTATEEPLDSDTSSPIERLNWTGDSRWATFDRPVGALVLLGVLVPFWSLGGIAGVLGWLAIVASWLLFAPVVPVVLGQFILVALTPADAALVTLLPAEAALLALLAATFLDSGAWLPAGPSGLVPTRQNIADALGYFGMAMALSALVVYVVGLSSSLVAGALCLGLVGGIGYVLRPALTE